MEETVVVSCVVGTGTKTVGGVSETVGGGLETVGRTSVVDGEVLEMAPDTAVRTTETVDEV